MKEFLINWIIGVVAILIVLFFVVLIPFLLSFVGLPDWVSFVYLFVFGTIVIALGGMKN